MATKISLTPAAIDALSKGGLADKLTPGLTIQVLKSSKKRWQFRRQVASTEVVATLFGGLYPAHSIAGARGCPSR